MNKTWWGEYSPNSTEINHWQIGPSQLWITQYPQEWRVSHHQTDDVQTLLKQIVKAKTIHEAALVQRFSFKKAPNPLKLLPALADRAMVVKPEEPFYVQAKEEVTIYVDSALWFQITVGQGVKLCEMPSHRPSDTWFGPSMIDGELCYANRTAARLRLEDLHLQDHRAITILKLHNDAKDALLLERLRLPVQNLHLYLDAQNRIWTQAVTLVRTESGGLAELKLGKGAPVEAGKVERLADAREKPEKNQVVRAFSKFFADF